MGANWHAPTMTTEDDITSAANQLAEDFERSGVARVPHAHHFPVRRMLEDGPVMGDCECGMTYEQWEDDRDYD